MASKTESAELPTVSLPFGMSKLLECMIRAVVIEKPENTQKFLADYASALNLYKNQNPSLDLKEVISQFQNRREAALPRKETSNGEDRTQSSEVTPTESVPEVTLEQETLLDKEDVLLNSEEISNGLDRTRCSQSPESVLEAACLQETPLEKDMNLDNGQTLMTGSKLSLSAAAASYASDKSQCPGPSRDFKASASLKDEENTQNMWTLYHLPHREEEGTLSTAVLSQPQYQNGAKIQVIGPGYVVVTKCPPTETQTDMKCIHSQCSKGSTQGLGQDCLVIKPPPYQNSNI